MTRIHVPELNLSVLAFEDEDERDAYEMYVTRADGKPWEDKGYDSDSCLYWLR